MVNLNTLPATTGNFLRRCLMVGAKFLVPYSICSVVDFKLCSVEVECSSSGVEGFDSLELPQEGELVEKGGSG